jgi:hypothetical protein
VNLATLPGLSSGPLRPALLLALLPPLLSALLPLLLAILPALLSAVLPALLSAVLPALLPALLPTLLLLVFLWSPPGSALTAAPGTVALASVPAFVPSSFASSPHAALLFSRTFRKRG